MGGKRLAGKNDELKNPRRGTVEEKYEALLNHLSMGVFRTTPGPDGRFLEANAAMELILGYTHGELLNIPVASIYVRPEERTLVLSLTKKELELIKKDGTVIFVRVGLVPVKNDLGEVIYYDGTAEDVTEHLRLANSLHESEAAYRMLFETTSHGIVFYDADWKIISVNPAAARIFGRSREEIMRLQPADSSWKAIREDGSDFPRNERPAMVALRTGQAVRGVTMGLYNPTEQKFRWLLVDSTPLWRPGEAKPYKTYTTFIDITERRKLEFRLSYLASYPEMSQLLLAEVSPAGELLYSNPALRKTFPDLAELGLKHPFFAEILDRPPLNRGTAGYEIKIGGKYYEMTPYHVGDSPALRIFAQDISARKELESKVIRERDRSQNFLNIAGAIILALDTQGIVTLINLRGCELLGLPMEQIVGRPWISFVPERLQAQLAGLFQQLIRGEEDLIYEHENPLLGADGEERLIAWHNSIVRDENGCVIGTLSSGEDITERQIAETALDYRNNLLTALINSPPDIIIFSLDQHYRYTVFNQEHALEMKRIWNADIQLGSSMLDFMNDPEACALAKKSFDRVLAGENFTEVQLQPGHDIFYEFNWNPIWQDNKVVGITAFIRDISAQRLAEQRLRMSEEKYRGLVEKLQEGIFQIGKNGIILTLNQAGASILGFESPNEVLGKNYRSFISDEEMKDSISQIVRVTGSWRGIISLENAQNEAIWVVISVSLRRTETGDLFEGTFNNITARKNAEDALQRNEMRLAESQALAHVGGWLWDIKKDECQLSDEMHRILGIAKQDRLLNLEEVLVFVHTEDWDIVRQSLSNLMAGTEHPILQYRIVHRDKSVHHVQSMTKIIMDSSGQPQTMIATVGDITHQKEMEAERLEMERKAMQTARLASVGEMAAGIAHEINNPLTAVIGFAELLVRQDLPPAIKGDLEIINNGAQRVANIIQKLLLFSRQTKPMRQPVSVNELIESTLQLRAYQLRSDNIEVITELAPDLPQIVADGGQLQQVFLNLIANAETEMVTARGKGRLFIKAEESRGCLLLTFKDDGPGITAENMAKLFQPFFTTRPIGKGTGLGLSICHGIIAEHKGHIWAESKYGDGAAFFVELPLTKNTPRAKVAVTGDTGEVIDLRILVVDDEEVVRQFVEKVLTSRGFIVDTADGALNAIKKLETEDYGLVLLDIKMPETSGLELYEKMREIEKCRHTRVVFLTGDVMGDETQKFLTKTQVSYLTKPFKIDLLLNEVCRNVTETGLDIR